MTLRPTTLCFLLCLTPGLLPAADGILDTGFSGDGHAQVFFDHPTLLLDTLEDLDVGPVGIVAVGKACGTTPADCNVAVACLSSHGALVTGFTGDGQLVFNFSGSGAKGLGEAVAFNRPGDRITIAGRDVDSGGTTRLGLAQLLPNGTFDSSFAPASGTPGRAVYALPGGTLLDVRQILPLPGGFLVAGVGSQTGFTDWDFWVARFHLDGTVDNSFGSGDGLVWIPFDGGGDDNDVLEQIAVQADGRIVGAGWIDGGTSDTDWGIFRLFSSGLLDSSFDGDGRKIFQPFDALGEYGEYATGIAVLDNGTILVAGSAGPSAGPPTEDKIELARFLSNGALDLSFGGGLGYAAIDLLPGEDSASALWLQGDGKIVVAGRRTDAGTSACAVARFSGNLPSLDATFGGGDGSVVFHSGFGSGSLECEVLSLRGGRPVIGGSGEVTGLDYDFSMSQLQNAYVFRDGFDSGSTFRWSNSVP